MKTSTNDNLSHSEHQLLLKHAERADECPVEPCHLTIMQVEISLRMHHARLHL